MYNPTLEKLRNQTEQRLHQKRMQQLEQYKQQTSMRSLFDPLLNVKAREKVGGSNWFETTALGYGELFKNLYGSWKNPGQGLINSLTFVGDTLDYAANLIKAPVLAIAKGEDVGERLADAYGLGDRGRITQNMSELREVIGAPTSGVVGGTLAGAMIGTNISPGWGTLIGAGVGLVVGGVSGALGYYDVNIGNTITDMALEMAADPANMLGMVAGLKTAGNISKVAGASDDVAKAVTKNTVKEIATFDVAQEAFKQSAKNFDDFARGARQGIDANSFLDTSIQMSAKQALINSKGNADDAAKMFDRFRKRLMKSYHEEDFDEFQRVLAEIGMFKYGDIGENVFNVAKAKQAFDVMVKDAGLSRAYKVMAMFDRFDANLSKKLLKATPMGISAMAAKKGFSLLKNAAAKKTISNMFEAFEKETKLDDSVATKNAFDKLDELGIQYKATDDMDHLQVSKLYDDMMAKADELEAEDAIAAAVLRKSAYKLVLDDGCGHRVVPASAKSDLNLIVRVWINNKGDLNKVISDPAVAAAYKNITNLLYFSMGEDILVDYITRMGYNKSLVLAIKKIGNAETLAKVAGASGTSGAHLIIADVLGRFAELAIDDDPAKQYIKTLNDISDKLVKQKEGALGAEKQLRYSINSIQRAIKAKYDSLEPKSVTKLMEIEYNKALVEAGRHNFGLNLKNYIEPKDYNKLYNARSIAKKVNRIRALQNKNLEEFMIFNRLLDNDISENMKKIKGMSEKIIKEQAPTNITQNSQSILLAIVKQQAFNALEKAKAGESLSKDELIKFEDEVNTKVAEMMKSFNITADDIIISSMANPQSGRTAAKLYRLLKSFKNQIGESPNEFYRRITEVEYNKQLEFIDKYNKDSEIIQETLNYFTKTKKNDLAAIDKYIKNKYKKSEYGSSDTLKVLKYIFENRSVIKDSNLRSMVDKLIGNYNIPKEFSDMLKDLNDITEITFFSRGGLKTSFEYIRQGFNTAMNPNNMLYIQMKAEINEKLIKDIESVSHLQKLFDEYFKDNAISQPLVDDMKSLLEDFRELNNKLMYSTRSTKERDISYIKQLSRKADNFVNNRWAQYSSYIYLMNHVKNLNVLDEDNFKYILSSFVTNIEELSKLPDDTSSSALKHTLVLGYSNQFTNTILNKMRLVVQNVNGKAITQSKEFSINKLNQLITNPKSFNYFLNDMTTIVKTLRMLEYVTKLIEIPNKKSIISDSINKIGTASEQLMNIVRGAPLSDVDIDQVYEKLLSVAKNVGDVYQTIIDKQYKIMRPEELNELVKNTKFLESNSSSFVKGINADLVQHYKTDIRFEQPFDFLEFDNKVIKLVTENGVEDLPDDFDIALDKFIKADIETTLIFNNQPTPENVVQLAFNTSKGKQNIIVYNKNYNRHGNKDLLDEDIVKGKYAGKAFNKGLVDQASWTVDGNTYTIYRNSELAFKAMYENIKDNIVDINGKKYIAVIGQNSTKFDDPVLLRGLNKYAGANLTGIVSEDTLPYVNLFRGLAQVVDLFDKKTNVKLQISNLKKSISDLEKSIQEYNTIIGKLKYKTENEAINARAELKVPINKRINEIDSILLERSTKGLKTKKAQLDFELSQTKDTEYDKLNYLNSELDRIKLKLEEFSKLGEDYSEPVNFELRKERAELINKLNKIDNSTEFDHYFRLKQGLEDRLEKAYKRISTLSNEVSEPNETDSDLFFKTLQAIKDLPNAKLENIYNALNKEGLVTDLSGKAHDASFDILMTEEIVNALHRSLGVEFKTINQVKKVLRDYSSGFNKYNEDTVYNAYLKLNDAINSTVKNIETDYERRMFNNITYGFNTPFTSKEYPNWTNPTMLVKLESYIEDIKYFLENRKDDPIYNKLVNSTDELKTILTNTRSIRESAMYGIFGDGIIQPRPNAYWVMDSLSSHYQSIRNTEIFIKLYDIYKGIDVDASDYSFVGLVKRFKDEFGTEAYQKFMDNLTDFYNYTERIDKFTQFNNTFNSYLNKRLASIDVDSEDAFEKREQLLTAFNRIQDKLFGFGTKDTNLSFDGWLRRMVSSQKQGYFLDAQGNRIASNVKFTRDLDQIKTEFKELMSDKGTFSFKEIQDELKLIDPDGTLEKEIINYINDCIDNLDKYNIFNREGNALTILKPVADSDYWNQFRNTYQGIIDGYTFAKDGVALLKPNELQIIHGAEYDKSIDPDIYDAKDELAEFMGDARRELRNINAEFNRCKHIGPIPEGWLNDTYNKNTWNINSSHSKTTFSHTGRAKNYYVNTGIRDKFYENMGIEFDPKKEMDVIRYRNEESAAIKAIQGIRDASGLYINEINEIIQEFNFKGMNYKLPKIKMYSEYYDEILEELTKAGDESLKEFKAYQEFAETMFKTTFGYLEESKQMDEVLREQYEQMYKAIAITMYISSVENKSVYDTLQTISRRGMDTSDAAFHIAKKSMNESLEQILNMFKLPNGDYNYEAMHYYISNNPNLRFTIMKKSDKFFKIIHHKKPDGTTIDVKTAMHELQDFDIDTPEELRKLVEQQLQFRNHPDYQFSILDKHSIADVKKNIGHTYDNRIYKLDMLNKLVAMRKWINKYIMAPMKTLSLYNLGFTFTNALEGSYKTFISTTGNRAALPRNYGNAIRMHKDWYNLTSEIAKATQGSMFWSTRDQLKLLEQEELIGKALFSNWEDVIKGNVEIDDLKINPSFSTEMANAGLPAYMISKFEHMVKNKTLDITKYAERFKRVHKVYTEELPKYNLDEYRVTSTFINSPAAAAEFQNIKKSAELNLIGHDKDDNIVEQALNRFLYSDKWMGENNPLRSVSPYANLSRNSDIELINRYAMYLNMVESGYTKNDALNKVLATHFNYGEKSNLEMTLEMFFPFISFPLRNFLYWSEALEEHPALLKSFIDMMICNWGDEKDNPYNQTKITKGGLRLWNDVSIESGLSAFDAMAFGGNALNTLTQRKLNPLVGVAIEGAKQLAVGESNLNYRFSRLPVVSHFQAGINLANNLIKGQPKLYDIAPSLFNEVYKNNRYYYANQGQYAYKSAYNRLFYASGQRRTGINKIRNMVMK